MFRHCHVIVKNAWRMKIITPQVHMLTASTLRQSFPVSLSLQKSGALSLSLSPSLLCRHHMFGLMQPFIVNLFSTMITMEIRPKDPEESCWAATGSSQTLFEDLL